MTRSPTVPLLLASRSTSDLRLSVDFLDGSRATVDFAPVLTHRSALSRELVCSVVGIHTCSIPVPGQG